jgi:TolB-like protein
VDGIHDDLLTYVSQISALKVISRTSVMVYRDSLKRIPEIARELSVSHVMEGGVQRAGDHVRINVQLIDARTDQHVWSNIYDRELTAANVFAIQSEIALAIAEALRATLSPEAEERIQSVPTQDLVALEAYFMGRQLLAKRNVPALTEAVARFAAAVERDPDFALAYVGLADAIRLNAGYSSVGPDEWEQALSKAQRAVDRALALNPMLGEAYATMGTLQLRKQKFEEAEAAFKRAIELNPNYAPSYQWYGEWLGEAYRRGESDRLEEALELSRKAIALDPKSAIITNDYGEVLQSGGRYEEALTQFEKSVELEPEFAPGLARIMMLKAMIYGSLDEALLTSRRLVSSNPTWRSADFHAYWYLELGDPENAASWRAHALELAPEDTVPDSLLDWALYQGDLEAHESSASKALAQDPGSLVALLVLDTLAWARDRPAEAIALYREGFPELFAENGPTVEPANLFAAVNLAALLRHSGEVETSDKLLEQGLAVIDSTPSRQTDWIFCFAIQEARIRAIRAERAAALEALPTVSDRGWWHYWWYWLRHDPVLKTLHDEPRYQAVRSEIEAEVSEQLARVHEWEASGKLSMGPQ